MPLFDLTIRGARDELGFVLKLDLHRGGDTIGLKYVTYGLSLLSLGSGFECSLT